MGDNIMGLWPEWETGRPSLETVIFFKLSNFADNI